MIAALIRNWRTQRSSLSAAERRRSGLHSAASISNSGSNVTLILVSLFCMMRGVWREWLDKTCLCEQVEGKYGSCEIS